MVHGEGTFYKKDGSKIEGMWLRNLLAEDSD
jgi:hypothetical protein